MPSRRGELKRFDTLLAQVATRLMSVGASAAQAETELVLDDLIRWCGADAVMLRRHDGVGHHPMVAGRASGPGGRIESIDRIDGSGVVDYPLLQGRSEVGVLQVRGDGAGAGHMLSTVATLFAHLWVRLDAEEQLAHQVHHDELTGLPNRRNLSELLDATSDDRRASLLILDIDNMKVINDGLDFEVGNRFIVGMARRLTSSIRPQELVARLAGDQFAVLVVDTPPDEVEGLARRLVDELAATIRLGDDLAIARSVSIGVAHSPPEQPSRLLLADADAALHQAKRQGKKRMTVFDDELRARTVDSFETEIELRRAIERGELTLHYQPEVDLDSGRICAVEALLRWNHPRRGLLTAGAFIETAEDSGLVVEIGDQVLRQAIGQLAQWAPDHPELEMWINVSPAQLMSRDLADQIGRLIDEFEVAPERICLEVTEHVMLGSLDATTGVLCRLRDMGIKLALDDFGTGYSSMKQLKQLPITALKIDMAFVAGLGISDHDSAIVDAAISLAAAFDLGTVAEGVETPQQIVELRKRGCRSAQGFLLARPASAEHISPLLRRGLGLGGPLDEELFERPGGRTPSQ